MVFCTCGNVDRVPATVPTNLVNTQTPLINSFGYCFIVISRWKERCVQRRCSQVIFVLCFAAWCSAHQARWKVVDFA